MAQPGRDIEADQKTREAALLRGIYFVYFGCGSLALTYFPLYLDALGLAGASIGLIFGGRTALAIVGQPPVTWLADRAGRPRLFLFAAFVVGLACALLLPFAKGFFTAAVAVWLAAPIVAAVVPLLDAFVVNTQGVARYGSYRLWGSVGFGLMVAGFGLVMADAAYEDAGRAAVWVYIAMLAVGALLSGLLPDTRVGPVSKSGARFAPGLPFVPFVIGHALHWAACVVMNVYFSLHMRDAGMATWVPGVAVAVAIVGEVAAFAFAARVIARATPVTWFVAITVLGAARWLITAAAPGVLIVVAVQVVHFLSFGVWFSLAMRQLGRFAAAERRTTLQGVFSAACFGGGGLIGSLIGGAVMDAVGGGGAFVFAAGLEAAALVAFLVSQHVLPAEPAE